MRPPDMPRAYIERGTASRSSQNLGRGRLRAATARCGRGAKLLDFSSISLVLGHCLVATGQILLRPGLPLHAVVGRGLDREMRVDLVRPRQRDEIGAPCSDDRVHLN